MKLTSSAFNNGEAIPAKYTADGKNISPDLLIGSIPEQAESLVLIVDDPDAPMGIWDHWIVWDIPTKTSSIAEGIASLGVSGRNSWGKLGYGGPSPPFGTHRYFFRIYALNTQLNLPQGSTKIQLKNAMKDHIVESSELMGTYSR